VKANATPSTAQNVGQRQHGGGRYSKVFDRRKRRIRGLWERNGAYYAQLTVVDENTGKKVVRRTRLEDADGTPVGTPAEAAKVMNKLKARREDNPLSLSPKRTPTFAEYAKQYLAHCEALQNKTKGTIHRERSCINNLIPVIGELRLRQINKAVVMRYMAARKKQGMSGRSVNIEIVTLRNVLRHAMAEGLLTNLQIDGVEWLHHEAKKRRLVSAEEIDRVCQAAIKHAPLSGQMLADFIRLMAYSGGRWMETLRLRWQDVDLERGQLTFGSDGQTKNRQSRVVDFNERLKAHLLEMSKRRQPDSEFIFPSPRRGESDAPTVTLNKALNTAREKSGVRDFTCHLCRHFFISMCVMSGIDFMTIARWVGHQDGGVLIGKVYGHLSNEHAKRQAQKVDFGPEASADPSKPAVPAGNPPAS
jgi:integrase